jgi:hypothetical protein
MRRDFKVWAVLATLLAVALLSALWASAHLSLVAPFGTRSPRPVPGDIELYYTAKTMVSTVNLALLIFLLITYIGIYRKTRSEFTIGLIIFSLVLLLHALTANPLVHWSFGFRAFGLGPFAMLPDFFTCAALIILVYLAVKY